MSFWTQNSLEPRRAFRFRLGSTGGLDLAAGKTSDEWWNAKTVTKPSYSVSSNEYQLVNQKYKVPGVVTWDPITITMADIGDVVSNLVVDLEYFGWDPSGQSDGLEKTSGEGNIGKIRIEQLSGEGRVIETWQLEGAYISRVAFGSLDYSSDDIVEIQITVDYDYALLDQPEGG